MATLLHMVVDVRRAHYQICDPPPLLMPRPLVTCFCANDDVTLWIEKCSMLFYRKTVDVISEFKIYEFGAEISKL